MGFHFFYSQYIMYRCELPPITQNEESVNKKISWKDLSNKIKLPTLLINRNNFK